MKVLALDLDAVLGDTRPLWQAWVEDLTRRARVELDLPADRVAAVPELDRAVGNWRVLLERFAEDHAPLFLRPDPEVNAALRRLHSAGVRIHTCTDAPAELARVALAHLGAARYVDSVGAVAPGTQIRSRDELFRAAA